MLLSFIRSFLKHSEFFIFKQLIIFFLDNFSIHTETIYQKNIHKRHITECIEYKITTIIIQIYTNRNISHSSSLETGIQVKNNKTERERNENTKIITQSFFPMFHGPPETTYSNYQQLWTK